MWKIFKKSLSNNSEAISQYIEIIIKIIEFIIVFASIYITYILLKDIVQGTSFNLFLLLVLMSLIGFIYVLLVIRDFFPPKAVDSNRITLLITMVIFYFSLFAGIVVFKNIQPLPLIPELPVGTVGLRSFGCSVTFKKIEVYFLDSANYWVKIPDEIINDSTNWKTNSFKVYGIKEPNHKFSQTNDSLAIQLINSGAVLNIHDLEVSKYFNGAKYFTMSAYVKFDTNFVDLDKKYKYPDAQLCFNVPIKNENEFYLGLSFPIENIDFTKFWIPLLEWRVGNLYRDSNSKLEENGFSDKVKIGKEYNLIGVSIKNSARILLRNDSTNASSIICESSFESKE